MMKNVYDTPVMEVIFLTNYDVVTLSGGDSGSAGGSSSYEDLLGMGGNTLSW